MYPSFASTKPLHARRTPSSPPLRSLWMARPLSSLQSSIEYSFRPSQKVVLGGSLAAFAKSRSGPNGRRQARCRYIMHKADFLLFDLPLKGH